MNLYPHQVLRENKMLTGAGADRMQSGMKHAFGKAMGLAARAKKGAAIIVVKTEEKNIPIVKEYMKKSWSKITRKSWSSSRKIILNTLLINNSFN